MQIEKETSMQSCNSFVDFDPTESLHFIAEAFFKLRDYQSSNEQLYKTLENAAWFDPCASIED